MLNFTHPNPTLLSKESIEAAAKLLDVTPAHIWTVIMVETGGCGVHKDRRPIIRYERHHFSRLTSGKYDLDYENISCPKRGGYADNVAGEYHRLASAMALDENAALQSCSWGIGQVMGFNYQDLGYLTVRKFVQEAILGEDHQLVHMAKFIEHAGIDQELRDRDWVGFAKAYNGPKFAENLYDIKLQRAFQRFTGPAGLPDTNVRAIQIWLTWSGFRPGQIDGVMGQRTIGALTQFQTARGLPPTGKADQETLQALMEPVPVC